MSVSFHKTEARMRQRFSYVKKFIYNVSNFRNWHHKILIHMKLYRGKAMLHRSPHNKRAKKAPSRLGRGPMKGGMKFLVGGAMVRN
jgi:hypothetical protein